MTSSGAIVAGLAAAAALWAATSPLSATSTARPQIAIGLLFASAVMRLAGQVSAINVLGALTLVLDVYAIGLLARLDQRARAVSPGWLAIAFAFSLPLERILQRSLGYGLQQLSADGSCLLLGALFDNVRCEGVRLILDGRDVLVDLPCSGARTLLLTLLGFALSAALGRPTRASAAMLFLTVLITALAANVLRIATLAVGIAHPAWVGGIDVMAAPWHDAIGLVALVLSLAPVIVCLRQASIGAPAAQVAPSHRLPQRPHRVLLPASMAALVAAIVIVNLPRRALDVAPRDVSLTLPAAISGALAEPVALEDRETRFFTQFGGGAAKARYGAHNLLLVRTSSPLRHLHAPDECLRGAGFTVSYAGASFTPLPTAMYLATAPTGERFRIDVSFVSERGHAETNVAAAVWRWLAGEARVWTAIQRISPADMPATRHAQWSAAALLALDLDRKPSPLQTQGDDQ